MSESSLKKKKKTKPRSVFLLFVFVFNTQGTCGSLTRPFSLVLTLAVSQSGGPSWKCSWVLSPVFQVTLSWKVLA